MIPTENSWVAMGKGAVLVQPAVVSGLLWESSESITARIMWEDPITSLLSWFISIMWVYLAVHWLSRYFFGHPLSTRRFVPLVLYWLAIAMGISAAIVVSSNEPSPSLAAGYLWQCFFLFWASNLAAIEMRKTFGPNHYRLSLWQRE